MNLSISLIATALLLTTLSSSAWAQTSETAPKAPIEQLEDRGDLDNSVQFDSPTPVDAATTTTDSENPAATINTLKNLASLKSELQAEIQQLSKRLQEVESSVAKKDLMDQIEKLSVDVKTTDRNIQELAAGADISNLRSKEEPAFNFQEELFSLLEPAMKEMKEMTSHVRQKTAQRDRIEYYSSKLPTAIAAADNLEHLLEETEDTELHRTLQEMLDAWRQQRRFLESEIQSATLHLEKLEREERTLSESSESYFKTFLQNRGLYLGQAMLLVIAILLASRIINRAMVRFIPGYQRAHRSFEIRLLDLTHKIITGLLVIGGPMVIFYFAEDWLLFSLGIMVLLGMAITLRHAIPRYWQLVQLFLNVGTVREGERIEMNGLPWLVQKINFYPMLLNPTAGLTRRVKIDDLLDIRSRETKEHEAWFPCRPTDWVLFEDGTLAKVISISEEFVELVLRGGARRTFNTSAFLDCAVKCLSRNFRIKETIGVSYSLQAESVTTICDELQAHVKKRIEEEGYGDFLLDLSVEFQLANTSSLDLAVIADFNGDAAHRHNRLRRSIQRWCVEACTKYGWEIPFTQVTIHQP